jgi:hypothetical protein
MARPNSEFLLAWDSLSGSAQETGWRSIPIAAAGSIVLHAGRRFPGNEEALLAEFVTTNVPVAEKLPDGKGFSVERADPHGDGKTWLALTRKASGGLELFTSMACDVVGALDVAADDGFDEPRCLRVFLGRVRAWQEFMRKAAQTLSPEAEIGLIGELTLLASLIISGVPPHIAIEGWLGPLDAFQDFEIGTGAMEVKATISTIGFPARIGSLEQLDNSVRQPLFIVGIRLKQTSLGKNLPDFVDSVRSLLTDEVQAHDVFSNRLLAAAYFDAHADRYPRRFELCNTRVLEIVEGFPRMTHATVLIGITRATYDLDLDKIHAENVELTAALKKLGVL